MAHTMARTLKGKAWKYGENVDTDVILPGRWCHLSKPDEIAPHCFEDLDPGFPQKVKKGDVVVAGENFGCGSSREIAPLAIKSVGVSCVIAKSFARIFYRNCINLGLPVVIAPAAADAASPGAAVVLHLDQGLVVVDGRSFEVAPVPAFLQEMFSAGGLVPWMRVRLGSS